jgi:hypothetical protein
MWTIWVQVFGACCCWGVGVICQDVSLKTFSLGATQLQFFSACTKLFITLVLLLLMTSSHSSSSFAWSLDIFKNWGVLFAVLDGTLSALASWCQSLAIQSNVLSTATVVCFTSLYPTLTRLILIFGFGEYWTWRTVAATCFIGLAIWLSVTDAQLAKQVRQESEIQKLE